MTGQLSIIVRVILGVLFIYAGAIKVADPLAFAGSVAAYKILPYFPSFLVAAVLPWVELISGVLLVTGWRAESAALMVLLLDLVFMAALVSVMARGLDVDCGCFRQGGSKTPAWLALLRDAVILIMAVVVLRGDRARRKLTA